jgi:RNA polymerase sigma-70 factor (ECF subfamily)
MNGTGLPSYERGVRGAPLPKREFEAELVSLIPELSKRARSLCRGSSESWEDLTQDALVKALQARTSFARGTSMIAWLATILRNLHVSLRRRARWMTPLKEFHLDRLIDDTRAQETWLEFQRVKAAFIELPQVQREAIAEVAIGGVARVEAARKARCPVGTLKSRLHRARNTLAAAVSSDRRILSVGAADESRACSIS